MDYAIYFKRSNKAIANNHHFGDDYTQDVLKDKYGYTDDDIEFRKSLIESDELYTKAMVSIDDEHTTP